MTLRLRCMRCGDWAEMRPADPLETGLCMACFQKYMRTEPWSAEYRRLLRYQRNQESHPTYKALVAALEALEAVPHGALVSD